MTPSSKSWRRSLPHPRVGLVTGLRPSATRLCPMGGSCRASSLATEGMIHRSCGHTSRASRVERRKGGDAGPYLDHPFSQAGSKPAQYPALIVVGAGKHIQLCTRLSARGRLPGDALYSSAPFARESLQHSTARQTQVKSFCTTDRRPEHHRSIFLTAPRQSLNHRAREHDQAL